MDVMVGVMWRVLHGPKAVQSSISYIFDTFSSGPRGDIAETFTSDGPGSSISAHGA